MPFGHAGFARCLAVCHTQRLSNVFIMGGEIRTFSDLIFILTFSKSKNIKDKIMKLGFSFLCARSFLYEERFARPVWRGGISNYCFVGTCCSIKMEG